MYLECSCEGSDLFVEYRRVRLGWDRIYMIWNHLSGVSSNFFGDSDQFWLMDWSREVG